MACFRDEQQLCHHIPAAIRRQVRINMKTDGGDTKGAVFWSKSKPRDYHLGVKE